MAPEAKAAVLARIRAALGRGDLLPVPDQARTDLRKFQSGAAQDTGQEHVLELFEDRLRDYDAVVERVSHESCAEAVAGILRRRKSAAVLMPAGIAPGLLPANHRMILDDGFSKAELDRFEAVVTQAVLGIAETGTIALQAIPGQGRRAVSLVPDFHLCLVEASTLVATVPEAFRRLRTTATLPTTFVSGPSATADIEMTRIKGVHGPRFLHVLLVV